MRAILLMIAGVSCFALIDCIGKLLAVELPVVEIIWARNAFALLPLALLVPVRRWPGMLASRRPLLQAGRALLPLLGGGTIVLGLRYMSLADATAITFVSPLIVTMLSIPLLGEHVGLHRWSAVIVGFAGVLVVARPGGGTIGWGALLPLSTAVSFAFYQIATRALARGTPPLQTYAYTIVIGAIASSLAAPFVWQAPSALAWALMVVSGVGFGMGHYCVIRAFDTAGAAALAPFVYTQLIAAALLGFVVFADVPDSATVAGALVIAASGLYVAYRERSIAARRRKSGAK